MARGEPEAKENGKQAHLALLRGINVGGKNPLPMTDLVEMFAGGQCSDVRTYIQSGNVIFRATREVYLHCPKGLGRSKLTNSYFDSRLATRSTCRNWRTTLTLCEMAEAGRLTSSRAT
jgi:uncharacterized protein (DUF1697 family)